MVSRAVYKSILYKSSGVVSRFTLMYLISEYFLIPRIDIFALGRLFIKHEMIKLMILRKGKRENIKSASFRKINFNKVRNSR